MNYSPHQKRPKYPATDEQIHQFGESQTVRPQEMWIIKEHVRGMTTVRQVIQCWRREGARCGGLRPVGRQAGKEEHEGPVGVMDILCSAGH